MISHCTLALSVTVSTCVPIQKGFTKSVTLILEKTYSKHRKSKNLFILRCRSYRRLPLFCVKDRTIEVQYRTVWLHLSFRCRAGFRALHLLRLAYWFQSNGLPSNWLCHNHSITSTEYRYFQRIDKLIICVAKNSTLSG